MSNKLKCLPLSPDDFNQAEDNRIERILAGYPADYMWNEPRAYLEGKKIISELALKQELKFTR